MSRNELIQSAISFLRDPTTQSSSLQQKIAFLESKGLTQPEIAMALSTSSSSSSSPGVGYGGNGSYGATMPTEFKKDWRDWFIIGVVVGSTGYVAISLIKKYILPHLTPPSTTELVASELALTRKYDEAALLLTTLQTTSDSLLTSIDEQKKDVEVELEEVRKVVREMKEGEKKRSEWCKLVEGQVQEIKDGLPKMLEKQSAQSSQSLADLSTELKSLKSLLLSRSVATPIPSRLPPTLSPSVSSPSLSNSTESPVPNTGTSSRASTFGLKAPGIPAWQLKGTGAGLSASTSSPTLSSTSSVFTPAPKSPVVDVEAEIKDVTASENGGWTKTMNHLGSSTLSAPLPSSEESLPGAV